jgi:hypothetical protein
VADLVQRGKRIAETADRVSAAFARELARVLRDTERALQPLLRRALDGDRTASVTGARGLALRRELRDTLNRAGFDRLVSVATTQAVEDMAVAVLSTRIGQGAVQLLQPDPRKLQALIEIGRVNLLQVGDDTAAALWRSAASWIFSARPTADILDDLFDALDDDVGALHTLFDTQVSMFGRQVEAIATSGLPSDQPFLYVGPSDHRNRPFCREHVGQVMTKDKIEALDNGQLDNPFITGGGYNCRHTWMAVESQELREIVNTGQRAPEFAGAL